MNRIYEYFVALGDLFMPRACLACGRRLGMRERHLCLSCAADVPYTRFWLAAHNPLADRFNAVLERHRGTEPMDYAYAAALIYYKGAYRAIPRALKYQGDLAAGRHYGALLGRRLAAAPHFADIDLVIPVPLHWTRRRSRGYNQAEILARALVSAYRSAPAPAPAAPAPAPAAPTTISSAARSPSSTVPSIASSSGPSKRWPVAAGHDDWVAPTTISSAARSPSSTVPSIASSSGPSKRWPVAAGHDDGAVPAAPPLAAPPLAAPSAAVPSTTSVSDPSERWPVAAGHDDGAVPAAPAPTSSSGTSERWPVEAGHDGGIAPTIVSSAVPSTAIPGTPTTVSSGAPSVVIPGGPRNLPEVRTDLLVRARRTRTQTRVSVDQKARNVASAFQVPERFPLWSRLISRLAQFFSSFLTRWPIGVGHDGNHLSSQNDNCLSGQDEDRLSGHEGNHLSSQDENRLLERESTRHSRLDRESPADVLASARHILLVDDTYTTGATLYACYAALRPFTTARISIATLAAVEGTPSLVGPSSGTGGAPSSPGMPSSPIVPSVPSVPSVPGDAPASASLSGP